MTEKQLFQEYKNFITKHIIDIYPKSYINPEKIGIGWCKNFPYSAKVEQSLIDETKKFLRIFVDVPDLKLLDLLTGDIANFLSNYTSKKYKNCDCFDIRFKAAKELKEILFDKNKYIQTLGNFQGKRKIAKAQSNEKRKKFDKAVNTVKQTRDKKFSSDVIKDFYDSTKRRK